MPHRRALVFLVSDFHWPRARHRRRSCAALAHHAVVPVVLRDPAEVDAIHRRGIAVLRDLETGEQRFVWLRRGLIDALRARARPRATTRLRTHLPGGRLRAVLRARSFRSCAADALFRWRPPRDARLVTRSARLDRGGVRGDGRRAAGRRQPARHRLHARRSARRARRISLPDGMRIDPESLPLPGRVAPWLEVRRATLGAGCVPASQALVVTYQIFAEAGGGDAGAVARVPAAPARRERRAGHRACRRAAFLLSPALPPTLVDKDRELRPSPEPERIAEARRSRRRARESRASRSSAIGYLLWRYDRLPFLPYAPGPLAAFVAALAASLADASCRRTKQTALLRDLHAALNQSAGETLYPSTLVATVRSRAVSRAAARARSKRVFAASWQRFYGEGEAPAPAQVLALLRSAADRERGVPC